MGTAAFAGLLAASSVFDLRERIVPNALVIALVGVWVISQIAAALCGIATPSCTEQIVGAFAVGAALLVATLLFERISKRNALGGGDIKLLAACTLFLGIPGILICLGIACALSVVLAFIIPHTPFAQEGEAAGTIPFVPAITLGALFVLFI